MGKTTSETFSVLPLKITQPHQFALINEVKMKTHYSYLHQQPVKQQRIQLY